MYQEWSFRFFVSIIWRSEIDLDCAVLRVLPVIFDFWSRLKLLLFDYFEIRLPTKKLKMNTRYLNFAFFLNVQIAL